MQPAHQALLAEKDRVGPQRLPRLLEMHQFPRNERLLADDEDALNAGAIVPQHLLES